MKYLVDCSGPPDEVFFALQAQVEDHGGKVEILSDVDFVVPNNDQDYGALADVRIPQCKNYIKAVLRHLGEVVIK